MHVLGLSVTGELPVELVPGDEDSGRRLVVERRAAAALRADWPVAGAERVAQTDDVLTVDRHPDAGFLVDAPGYGTHRVSADGRRVVLAADAPGWRAQRLLVSQTLPLAATLQGVACLHASAVVVDGGAVIVVGASGAGKSTLAAGLLELGAGFLADDVVALTATGVHPGPRFARLDPAQHATLGPAARATLGAGVEGDGKLHFAPSGVERAVAARMVVVLDRGGADALALREVAEPVKVLLAAAFVPYVTDAAVLGGLLDACAELAGSVPVLRLAAPASADRAALAAFVAAAL